MTNDNSARLAALRQEAANRASYPESAVCDRTAFEVQTDGYNGWCHACRFHANSHDY